jgi:hypothetical protein
MALIDQWLGDYQYREHHSIEIRAECGDAYQALNNIDLGDSRLVRFFFALRGVPMGTADGQSGLPMRAFLDNFTLLDAKAPEELLVGAIGRFWRVDGGGVAVSADRFRDFTDPGVAKLVMSFATQPIDPGRTRLSTETRIFCTDGAARRRFRVYWYLIRPASGLIRREMLRLTKRRAEAQRTPSPSGRG